MAAITTVRPTSGQARRNRADRRIGSGGANSFSKEFAKSFCENFCWTSGSGGEAAPFEQRLDPRQAATEGDIQLRRIARTAGGEDMPLQRAGAVRVEGIARL